MEAKSYCEYCVKETASKAIEPEKISLEYQEKLKQQQAANIFDLRNNLFWWACPSSKIRLDDNLVFIENNWDFLINISKDINKVLEDIHYWGDCKEEFTVVQFHIPPEKLPRLLEIAYVGMAGAKTSPIYGYVTETFKTVSKGLFQLEKSPG